MYRKILHANDSSEGAFRALAAALSLARHYRAELHMVSVEEVGWIPGTREEVIGELELADQRFAQTVARAQELAKARRVKLHPHVLRGHAVQSIVEFVRTHGFDLLVIGFMGHTALYDRVIGGTSERLVRLAPCTVVVVK